MKAEPKNSEKRTKSPAPQKARKLRLRRVALLTLLVFGALCLGCHLWAHWEYHRGQQAEAGHDFVEAQKHFARCLNVWFLSSKAHLSAARVARRAQNFKAATNHLREYEGLIGRDDALDLESKLLRAQQGDFKSVAG